MKYGALLMRWLPLGITITGFCVLIYTSVQQVYRQSSNDPQIQIAEDAERALSDGAGIENVLWKEMPLSVSTSTRSYIDIASSLSPWTAYYAPDGTPLESTGLFNGSMPRIPQGVFEAARSATRTGFIPSGEDRVTWQPEAGIRQAIVVVKVRDQSRGIGFVVSGRNMREQGARESDLRVAMLCAWVILIAVTLGIYVATYRSLAA